ncbi:M23 family metallopeptidase [Ilumatobacter coccineus]|uniref:Putative metalloendopeptidase n=1 Tax=Ilumatobacter coccineus (strain NBRC 103263 / KCTC 29153 / YM16-304) TaxID=1313172 RepID=A0A6C7EBH1_ILUCY|nr:M23 family metallopeptidase [Ilumatobacter coccineus]BAN04087.1 putative metalloendopeptidase [Ilumatobacter coccineus YM16-304]
MNANDTPSRRQFLRGLAGATGLVGAAGAASLLGNRRLVAADPLSFVGDAAGATQPAVRLDLVPPSTVPIGLGELTMPAANLDGGLICLNNFNGRSTANGACNHRGVDIGENGPFTVDRPLVACTDGVIERDEVYVSSGGNMRILYGDDGRWYRYHHLSSYEEGVEPGDRVVRGQTIGYMGKTGNTQWTHLHFEVWAVSPIPRDGTALDPVPLIEFPPDVVMKEPTACEL